MSRIPFPNQTFLVYSGSSLLNEADFDQIFELMNVGGGRDRGSNSE